MDFSYPCLLILSPTRRNVEATNKPTLHHPTHTRYAYQFIHGPTRTQSIDYQLAQQHQARQPAHSSLV